MSIQRQVLEALYRMVLELGGGLAVSIGALPPAEGLALAIATGRDDAPTLGHGATVTLDVTVNAKHARQQTALDTLASIHETLMRTQSLPMAEGWQMIAIRTSGTPGYLDREDGLWLYGSALSVQYTVDGAAV